MGLAINQLLSTWCPGTVRHELPQEEVKLPALQHQLTHTGHKQVVGPPALYRVVVVYSAQCI